MSILRIYGGRAIRAALAETVKPVQATYLALDRPAADTAEALADLSALSPYVTVNVKQEPTGEVDQVIIRAENGRELRFVGPPLGAEIAAMVSAVIVAGRGYGGLSAATQEALTRLTSPMHVQIFTTPSWPGCARVVSLAHKFAIENPQITVEAISAVAMPELARAYNVLGTPYTVLNDQIQLKGQLEEAELLAAIQSLGPLAAGQ